MTEKHDLIKENTTQTHKQDNEFLDFFDLKKRIPLGTPEEIIAMRDEGRDEKLDRIQKVVKLYNKKNISLVDELLKDRKQETENK